jgi:hypothetical protein
VADRAHGLDRRFERRGDKAERAFEEMMARNKIDVATTIKKAVRGCVDKVGRLGLKLLSSKSPQHRIEVNRHRPMSTTANTSVVRHRVQAPRMLVKEPAMAIRLRARPAS